MEEETEDRPLEEIIYISEEHGNKIIEDLQLHNNTLLKEAPEVKRKVSDLVKEFADVFSEEGKDKVGSTGLIEFEVQLKEGARPVRQKLRPLNPQQKASLQKQMDTWERENIIQKSNSPWKSPMVAAKKSGGDPGEIRWAR